ncbi:MAG: hypothetical protein WD294_14320 [Phycisphaeraceae bacterium]
MSEARAARFERMGQRLSDFVNPIAVKEMRQAVAGKTITGVLVLFLIVQAGVVAVYTLTSGTGSQSFGDGPELFMFLLGILLATCLLFVPGTTAYRLASERSDQNVDLMFITTLKPWRIISGKFVSAMVMTLLIYSLCLPFLTLAYLLRGIDLPTIFTLLAVNLMVISWCVLLAIFVASIPMARFARSIVQFGTFMAFVSAFSMTMQWSYGVISFGVLTHVTVLGWLGLVGFYAGTALLLFTLAVAAVSPASSNRAVLPRACFVVVWAGTGVLAFAAGYSEAILLWGWGSVLALGLASLAAIGERDVLNRRLAAKVPRRHLLRVPAFLLFSGAANGIAWTLLLMAATVGIVWSQVSSTAILDPTEAMRLEVMATYLLSYSLVGFLLVRLTPLGKLINPAHTFAMALILMALGTAWPVVAAVLTGNMMLDQLSPSWWITSVGVVFSDSLEEPLWLGRVAVVLLVGAQLPWLVRRIARFRPPRAEADAPATPAVEVPTTNGDDALQPAVVTEENTRG